MKKQTAVEWLEEQINLGLSERGLISAIKEAKQMEKEQIIEADLAGVERTLLGFSKFPNLVGDLKKPLSLVNDMKEGRDTHDNGIEYYNETYGQTKN
jgi:hypothetical protein